APRARHRLRGPEGRRGGGRDRGRRAAVAPPGAEGRGRRPRLPPGRPPRRGRRELGRGGGDAAGTTPADQRRPLARVSSTTMPASSRRAVLLLLSLALAACAPRAASPEELAQAASRRSTVTPQTAGFVPTPANHGALRQREEGTPDLVIIAFSGHCGLVCHTRNTWSYLDTASERTGGVAVLDAIRGAYEAMGLSVDVFSASSFVTAHYSGISREMEPGYLQAQAYLDEVKDRKSV